MQKMETQLKEVTTERDSLTNNLAESMQSLKQVLPFGCSSKSSALSFPSDYPSQSFKTSTMNAFSLQPVHGGLYFPVFGEHKLSVLAASQVVNISVRERCRSHSKKTADSFGNWVGRECWNDIRVFV